MLKSSLVHSRRSLTTLIAIASLHVAVSKIFDRCELARELRDRHSIAHDQIGTFVCIAERQSSLNTQAVAQDNYFGLFQIGSEFWCDRNVDSYKACGVSCASLQDDDLADDVECVKTIFQEHQRIFNDGFQAWPSGNECQSQGKRIVEECLSDSNSKKSIKPSKNQRNQISRILSSTADEGKVYERCELARELLNQHKMPMNQIATWVCIAKHESNFNTSAIGRLNWDGSEDHGLFQISDIYWCGETGKACGVTCEQMRDNDISNDVECIKQIHAEHTRLSGDGFTAWAVYPRCKGQADSFIEGCFDSENEIVLPIRPVPGVQQQPSKNYAKPSRTRNDPAATSNENNVEVGKVYERCNLAQELRFKFKIPLEQVATWVCIAKHESNFNTSAIGRLNADGSEDHGLFQIRDIYWCGDGAGKACGVTCEELRDNDISNDVQCVMQIHEEHQRFAGDGFTAWAVYPRCKGQADSWIDGCFSEEQEFDFRPRPAVTQPPPRRVFTTTQTQKTQPTTAVRFDVKTIAQDFDEPIVYSTTEKLTTTRETPTTTTRRLSPSTSKTTRRTTTPTISTTRRISKPANNAVATFNRIDDSGDFFRKTSTTTSTSKPSSTSTKKKVVGTNNFPTAVTTRTTSRKNSIDDQAAKNRMSKSKSTLKPFNIFEFYLRDFTSRAPFSYRSIQFSDRSTVVIKKKDDDVKLSNQRKNNPAVTTTTTKNRVPQEIKRTTEQPTQLSFFDELERFNDNNENISNRIGRVAPRITPHSFEYLARLTTPRTHGAFGVYGR